LTVIEENSVLRRPDTARFDGALPRRRVRLWGLVAVAVVAVFILQAINWTSSDAAPAVLASSSTTPAAPSAANAPLVAPSALVAAGRAQSVGTAGALVSFPITDALPQTFDPLSSEAGAQPTTKHIAGAWLGPTATFPALGNADGFGDCTIVAVSNIVTADRLRAGVRSTRSTMVEALSAWRAINGGTTSGVGEATLLDAWSSPAGVMGTTITGWQSLNVLSERQIKHAIVGSGALYATLVVSQSLAWSSLIWSRIPTSGVAHAVALIGWTSTGWLALSWGEVVSIPWSYWNAQAMSAVATVS
jgi:hypothetical protein